MEDINKVIEGVVAVLRQASVPDTQTQKRVAEYVQKLLQSPNCAICLSTIFNMEHETVEVRQQAGLLLKNHIAQQCTNRMNAPVQASSHFVDQNSTAAIPAEVMTVVKETVLRCLRDGNKAIMSTAGTIVTTIIGAEGVEKWPHVVNYLVESLGRERSEVFETAFETLVKIVEDELSDGTLLYGGTQPSHFCRICKETLLPRIFQLLQIAAQSGQDKQMIQFNCITLLNVFASYSAFAPEEALDEFFIQYFHALGALAVETAPHIKQKVVTGMIHVAEFNQLAIISNSDEVVSFMVACTEDMDYKIRLDALEFWPILLRLPNADKLLINVLPRLLTCLVENTRYTEWDYLQMDIVQLQDDNAAQMDRIEDIQPRFHDGGAIDDDDGDGRSRGKVLWGSGWTVRKASALALDLMANKFGRVILPHVLPLIETRLLDNEWELREAAVLTLGAISQGCQDVMAPFLPNVLTVLLNLCDDSKPLLRSIAAWCLCKYARWACKPENRQHCLQPLLAKILSLTLDRNKSVQEAAASAFATIEEEARHLLIPFIDDICTSLCAAFDLYQVNNLLVLYDAVGTLADCVGQHLNRPSTTKLMEKIFEGWQRTASNNYALIALFECVACLASALQGGFAPYAKPFIVKCVTVLDRHVTTQNIANANCEVSEGNQSGISRELVDSALDLLSSIVEAVDLNALNCFEAPTLNFVHYIRRCCEDPNAKLSSSTFVSAFALVGRLARNNIEHLKPELPALMPLIIAHLGHGSSSVSNNAAWALGELAVKAPPDMIEPYMGQIIPPLCQIIRSDSTIRSLRQNACFTLSRVGCAAPEKGAMFLEDFLYAWCVVIADTPNDPEKVFSIQGLCSMLQHHQSPTVKSCVPLMEAVASFYSPSHCDVTVTHDNTDGTSQSDGTVHVAAVLPPPVVRILQAVFLWVRNSYSEEWKNSWEASRERTREIIQRHIIESGVSASG